MNWLRWVWIWPATKRRFCPVCRACRPRGRTSKYNSFLINTQWDRAKMDAPVTSVPRRNGAVKDTLSSGLHWFLRHTNIQCGDNTDALTPSPSRYFTILPTLDGHPTASAHTRSPSDTKPLWSKRETRVQQRGPCSASQIISRHISSAKGIKKKRKLIIILSPLSVRCTVGFYCHLLCFGCFQEFKKGQMTCICVDICLYGLCDPQP